MNVLRTALILTPLLAAPLAHAQNAARPTLPEALALAYRQGPDLAKAQTNLQDAQANLRAQTADPSVLIGALTQAQNAAALAEVQLGATRLTVMQNVVNAYLSLYETQQNVALYEAQAALDQRNVQMAEAKLQTRAGTSLDVSRAQNTLNTTRQNLANANAQLGVRASELARLFGQSSSQITPVAPPAPPELKTSLTTLAQGLYNRLPSVVQAQQQVAVGELNVRLYNNDYTPRLQLQTAQADLENARRDLANAQKSATTSLNDAYRSAQDTFKRIAIEQDNVKNAQTTLRQNQTRYQSGVISRLELQTSEVALQSAQYGLTQAVDAYWKALAALSVAAGIDVTGLVAKATP
ncbi:outer membrane protein TolC [Deinobacterium chartae]|uniref:Outer membrane protein TolC n=1 Tax=Deinobacterium chartae TaxID=521158 RepID=A0A841I087_9DEIO|nr:TolC family protein [Deinobacterium chartae]MBB6097532.1 outer membrane protein TolC [Deinobacterium chartae]